MNESVLDSFCNTQFWNESTLPIVSDCFQHTVLVYVPCIFYLVMFPILLLQCYRARSAHRFLPLPISAIFISKVVVASALVIDSVFLFARYFSDKTDGYQAPLANLFYPIFLGVTSALLLFGHVVCKQAGIVSSGIIFNSWLLLAICGCPEVYQWVQLWSEPGAEFSIGRSIGFFIWWGGCLIQFFLFCFPDARDADEVTSEEYRVSFMNRMTLWWFNRVPFTGARKNLEADDLFRLHDAHKADHLEKLWDKYWLPTMQKYNEKRRHLLAEHCSRKVSNGINGKAANGNGVSHVEEDKGKHVHVEETFSIPPPSVIYNLFRMFKFEFIAAMAVKGCAEILVFVNPLMLNLLLTNLMDEKGQLWKGIVYGVLMFFNSELRSFMQNHYLGVVFRIGMKLQTAMTAAVYRKTLNLSNVARKDKSVGEIVNLMTIDIERFQMIVMMCNNFWSAPMQITLAMIFLLNTLGWSALPGALITCSYVPYTLFTSKFLHRWMAQQMKLKDERTKICNEVLNGIKVVKLYAWEMPMIELIERIRKQELVTLFKSALLRMTVDMYNWSLPFLVAAASFAVFVYSDPDHLLTPQIAFVSLTLFNQLRFPMTIVGMLINMTVDTVVSNKRLKEFFVAEELEEDAVQREALIPETIHAVEVDRADFSWEVSHDSPAAAEAVPNLKDITMRISRGSLVAVVGRVGSGKSSLLSALLGEMEKLRGDVAVRGKIAYVPQQAWIQNMTLRDNILFGQPFVKKFYERVLEACALVADLAILPHGDKTEIGEKGINMSGGQKARISLARAIYQNCDIYFLDDPLSAVDSHVGKHIFNKVIGPHGLLRNKTRILVTHGITFLKQVDQVIMVEDGCIVEQGLYQDLKSVDLSVLSELIVGEPRIVVEPPTPVEPKAFVKDDENDEDDPADDLKEDDFLLVNDLPTAEFIRQFSTTSMLMRGSVLKKTSFAPFPGHAKPPEKERDALMTKETVNVGRVKSGVYLEYVKAGGYAFMLTYLVLYFAYQGVMMGRNFWLSSWADDYELIKNNQTAMDPKVRLGVYAGLGGVETTAMLLAMCAFTVGTVKASKNLHEPVLVNVLKSPMSFFDTTPLGRILNRLSKDVEIVDVRFPQTIKTFILCFTQIVFILIINSTTNPLFIAIIVPLAVVYLFALKFYIPTSRQLRRLESNQRSPIYSHFSEAIQGAQVIRAYARVEEFCQGTAEKINNFTQIRYTNILCQRWLGLRLDIIGNVTVLFAAVLSVLATQWGWISSPGLVGLSISYALTITEVLNFAVRQVSELETNIVSVERLKEYVETETEAAWKIEGKEPPKGWPGFGQIKFNNYSTRYREGLDLVVKNISADVRPGEKIGIVGRTGAGKSSLTLALFRMIEAAEGQIAIDGVVIAEIGLHDLRSNITIIPQDPVLFSGSLRFNLDPFDKYTDDQIWSALELAHLKQFISQLPEGLEHKITEGGENISVGQRQLVCLARALLRRSKVLVLDEATAAVDLETDALIQETIRREFKNSTIFTIAHRLNTILDYDRVMVLDKGEIKEFDSPGNLLNDRDSLFTAMIADSKATSAG